MPIKEEIRNFIRQQLENHQPRDDYLELLNLVLILIGEKTNTV